MSAACYVWIGLKWSLQKSPIWPSSMGKVVNSHRLTNYKMKVTEAPWTLLLSPSQSQHPYQHTVFTYQWISPSASPPISMSTKHFSKRQYLINISKCSLTIHSPLFENHNHSRIKLVLHTVHSPKIHYLLDSKKFKIYIKIHTNIASTCFGLRPSSGSLHWTWLKLYLC